LAFSVLLLFFGFVCSSINVTEYRRGNQNNPEKLATTNTQEMKKNIAKTMHYVLDTTMRKQTQIT